MARPPLPIGSHGRIKRTKVGQGKWQALCRVRDADGITRRAVRYTPEGVHDKTGAAAERTLINHLTTRTHTTGDDITGDTTINQLWDKYREHLIATNKAVNTIRRYTEVARFISDGLGGIRLRELTTQKAETFLSSVEKSRGTANAITTRSVLSGMCGMAARFDALPHNPIRETTTPTSEPKPTQTLEPEQVEQLLRDLITSKAPCPEVKKGQPVKSRYKVPTVAEYAASADIIDTLIMFAATGVREGHLFAFAWSDLDFTNSTAQVKGRVIRIPSNQLASADDPALVRVETENSKNPHTTIALPQWAVSMLKRRKIASTSEWVFPSTKGTLREPTNFNKQWRRIRHGLDLPEWVTTHTFRRSLASWLDEQKLTPRAVADQLGHARPSMTMDKYMSRGKPRPEIAQILDRIISVQ